MTSIWNLMKNGQFKRLEGHTHRQHGYLILHFSLKLSLSQTVEAHRVVRRRGSHIIETIGSQMAVRLSAPRDGRTLLSGRLLVLISVRGWVDLRAMMRLEGLGKLRNPVTWSGIEPATFRLVAQCLNQLRYPVPPPCFRVLLNVSINLNHFHF
jgi:hypothetical protein